MVCDRSPLATAPITRAVSLVGWTRSSISALTESTDSAQEPADFANDARWRCLPSLPTTRLSRSSSSAMRWFSSITSLNASAILPSSPSSRSAGERESRPFLKASNAANSKRLSSPTGPRSSAWSRFRETNGLLTQRNLGRFRGTVGRCGSRAPTTTVSTIGAVVVGTRVLIDLYRGHACLVTMK